MPTPLELPETDAEVEAFLQALDEGRVTLPTPPPNVKLMCRLVRQHTKIEHLEAENRRWHDLWHTAEEKLGAMLQPE